MTTLRAKRHQPGGAVKPGVFDQRGIEARHDVLVYTSEPLAEAVGVGVHSPVPRS